MTLNLSNTISRGRNALLVALLAATASARTPAQGTETHSFTNLNKVIEDGNASGLSDVQTVTSAITNLTSVRLALHIAGEFNGDLYAYVRHIQGGRTNFCVLLNRVGRTVSNPAGYADPGLDVVLEDAAPAGDIHRYGTITNLPAGTPLTGTWQPDGRRVDPDEVLDSTERTATLSAFNGADASGEWTLYLADMASGGSNLLVGWELELAGIARPPVSLAGTVAYYPTNYPSSGLSGKRVGNVTMSLTGDTTLTTNTLADGSYGLTNIPVGGTYCVTPSKADDSSADNGVDAIDQVLIQRHILGRTPDLLDSPYKLLAADVDDSGQIDAIDQVLIQRLILGRSSQFPAGLWRFVPTNYVFLDPQNPWNASSNLWYTNLVADVTHADFVAIKLGDVNNSWTAPAGAQSLLAKSAQGQQALGQNVLPEVVFAVSQQSAQPGQMVAARVTVSGFSRVTSAQFSLVWDPTVLRYVGTGSYGLTGVGAGCFGTGLTASGKLGFAWYDPEADGVTLADGTVLFRVSFEVIGKVGSVSAVALAGAPTAQVVSVDVTRVAFGAQDGNVSVVGPGVLVTTPGYANGAFRLSVPTEKGRSYILEFTDTLAPAKWTALPAVVGDGTVMVLVNPTATNQHRFYRVRVQ
jgi:subtilisin-like proprotein convertase family protein